MGLIHIQGLADLRPILGANILLTGDIGQLRGSQTSTILLR